MVGPGPTVVDPDTPYGALVMSVARRGVDVLMDCCRPPVVAGLPLQQKDPGTCGLRGPRVVRLVGGTQHHVLCAANRSLLDSCDSCGNARGRLARRPRFERFVTLLYHCHLYLAYMLIARYES